MSEENAINRMAGIPGWFSPDEARLLYRSAYSAFLAHQAVVEIGSYQGRSTIVLGSAAINAGGGAKVHAIDPHEGNLSGSKQPHTWEAFELNIRKARLNNVIVPIRKKSIDVQWAGGDIGLLFIDGLHSLEGVTADYKHFYRFVPVGGLIAFHDYANKDHPDVKNFVDARIHAGELEIVSLAMPRIPENTLIVTRKLPRLSIIIPTCGRHRLVKALNSLVQHGARPTDEVIVVGDGSQPVAQKIVSEFPKTLSILYFEHGPTRMVGAAQRNFAITKATGTHLAFIDDDDEYVDGGINEIRMAITGHPRKVLIFKEQSKVKRHIWGVVWKDRKVEMGNVGTQGVIVPNVAGKIGHWPNRICSDYHFIRATLNLYPERDGAVIWVDRIIACLYDENDSIDSSVLMM